MPLEVLLAIGYALLLAGVAAALEWTAWRVHRRAQRFQIAGFSYSQGLDRWQCPPGQHLHRHSTDHRQGRVVYRAHAPICNRCHAKASCTDSDEGRTLEIEPDAWVNSSMARFHRGLSLALLLLAELVLGVEALRVWEGQPSDRRTTAAATWLLAALMLALGTIALRLAQKFFTRTAIDAGD